MSGFRDRDMENRGAPQGAPQVVRVAKRTNPLAIVMFLIFVVLGIGIMFQGGPFLGAFLVLSGFAFLGVKEDAER